MTPKQRFVAAMNHKKPGDYISFMEVEFQIHEEYIGKNPVLGYEFGKLSGKEREKAIHHNVEIMIETAEKAGHDVIRPFGGYWEISPGEPALIFLPEVDDQLDHIRLLKKMIGDKYYVMGTGAGTMGIPDGNHIMEFVYNLFDRPDEVKEELEKNLLWGLDYQNKQLDAGVDGIINCGDIAFNNGPFISPAQCDEFLFPYFNRWVDNLKSQGVHSIWHTDGNIMPIMDRVLESGVNAIQCVDPLGGMDIVKLKEQVGDRLTLIGNINCANLQLASKEEIEEEVKKVVEGCKGNGGFVLSGCNSIFKGISAENYQVMVDARYKYGKEN
jgi:uroporphyrinogen decarboxylase